MKNKKDAMKKKKKITLYLLDVKSGGQKSLLEIVWFKFEQAFRIWTCYVQVFVKENKNFRPSVLGRNIQIGFQMTL